MYFLNSFILVQYKGANSFEYFLKKIFRKLAAPKNVFVRGFQCFSVSVGTEWLGMCGEMIRYVGTKPSCMGLFYQNTAGTSRLSLLISVIKQWRTQNHECKLTDASIPTSSILFHLSVKADSFHTSHLFNSQINRECRQLSEPVRIMRGSKQRFNNVAMPATEQSGAW